ncbi:MAG: hypothetical protein GY810_27850 [Aureispira sp.]|nr:hypothetical protein [Aureispira sp.]
MNIQYIVYLTILSISLAACHQTKPITPTDKVELVEPAIDSTEKEVPVQKITAAILEGKWLITGINLGLNNGFGDNDYDFGEFDVFDMNTGNISLQLDNNTCKGSYTIIDNQINIEKGILCTKECCDSTEIKNYSALLPNKWDCSIVGNHMTWTIKNSTKKISFTRHADPQLSQTKWRAIRMSERDSTDYIFEEEDNFHLHFLNQNVIRLQLGKHGCFNHFIQKETQLSFNDEFEAYSRSCCPRTKPYTLRYYFTTERLEFKVDGDQLILSNANVELEFARDTE